MPLGAVIYALLFTLSGFAGLIYESIWSHYLKLLLGHAAYAQTLVLVIFMGGMAIGAWLAGRYSAKLGSLLVAYAAVEAMLAGFALVFHAEFVYGSRLLYDTIIPNLDSALLINAYKWSLGGLLILPQSLLLGMTFPLMCGGVLRRWPGAPGMTIATLYFCNSLGAAAGVLASGFWLIAEVGLPGTIMTAGLLNAGIALAVWMLNRGRRSDSAAAPAAAPPQAAGDAAWHRALLLLAAITGLSSFIYEIGWIRMLSMVLGSATQSFELMLAAFILGLAFGGWWIRRRIDRLADLRGYLAVVQLAMGGAALLSLALYGQTFEAMQWLLSAVQRSSQGFALYLAMCAVLVMTIMLPVTFCAGMTLPLITSQLLRQGRGERVIGQVYGANTIGAILGVLFTVHIGFPALGLKGSMIVGAALDIALGLALLLACRARYSPLRLAFSAVLGASALLAALVWIEFDPYRMASGVYRHGIATIASTTRMLFQRDGKTATISVQESRLGMRSISTNGKPDATIAMRAGTAPAPDEITMVMAAAVPLALHREARTVANIGLGSGLTTSVLLAHSGLEEVDTIEIEPAMVDGAKHFRPRVQRAYTDPRSRIHIEDAKSFFAGQARQYDLIVSEPSNPWVSGVASLFTTEFYRVIHRHLRTQGLFVQWLQIYEIDVGLVTSVIKALNRNFTDYAIYSTDDSNLLIIAAKDRALGRPDPWIFDRPALAAELARVGIASPQDLQFRRVGSKAVLGPLFERYPEPVNSDYFPYLDSHANRSRFLQHNAIAVSTLRSAPFPLMRWLDLAGAATTRDVAPVAHPVAAYTSTLQAWAAADKLLDPAAGHAGAGPLSIGLDRAIELILRRQSACEAAAAAREWLDSVHRIAHAVLPFLTPQEALRVLRRLRESACVAHLAPAELRWLELFEAVVRDEFTAVVAHAHALLEAPTAKPLSDEELGYLVAVAMCADLALNDASAALRVWTTYASGRWQPDGVNIHLQLLYALATVPAL